MSCWSPCVKVHEKTGERYYFPCGRCPPCLKRKRNDWIIRFAQQLKSMDGIGTFITWTYDDNNVPRSDTGHMTLRKDDFLKFQKKFIYYLKKYDGIDEVKYYSIGEYGTNTHRPHYHTLLFGVDIETAGYRALHMWHFGNIKLKPINSGNIGYVANFHIIVKQKYDEQTEQEAEFACCSNGLGIPSFNRLNAIRSSGYVSLHGFKHAVPRYYLSRLDERERRELGVRAQEYYRELTSDAPIPSSDDFRQLYARRKSAVDNFRRKARKTRKN